MNKKKVLSFSLRADYAEALKNFAAGRGMRLSEQLEEIVLYWFVMSRPGQWLKEPYDPPKPKGSIWDKL